MPVVIDTDDHPHRERLERFRRVLSEQPMAFELGTTLPPDFSARLQTTRLGSATVALLTQRFDGPADFRRTAPLIRRCDPRTYRVLLPLCGETVVRQDGREARLEAGDLAVHDSSRPMTITYSPTLGPDHECAMLTIPRTTVAVSPSAVGTLTGTRLAGHDPVAALFATVLTRLAHDAPGYDRSTAARISNTAVDLLTALLCTELDRARPPAPPPGQALLAQVQAYGLRRLGDPALDPALIAAAHHMSTRALHALFRRHDLTVAAWIRRSRLEGCRRDLSDPQLHDRPIQAIRSRWGFTDAAVFSRSFRAAYGLGPQAYRRSLQTAG